MTERRTVLLKNELEKKRLDAFLVTNPINVTYLSGFGESDSTLLVTRNRNYLFTDSRYIEDAKKNVSGFAIKLVRRSMYTELEDVASRRKLKKIGFEASNLPYGIARKLGSLVVGTRFVPTKDIVESLRAVKDAREIGLIRSSIRLAEKVMMTVSRMVAPGTRETDLSRDIEMEFIKRGARSAFSTIAASGPNSSMPHARPGNRKIGKNDFVMIDMGCASNAYCSDITRMFTTGRMQKRFMKIYDCVRTAHDLAIDSVRPGITASSVDSSARNYIRDEGYGKFFGHSLGHGVGMEVHEAPSISGNNETPVRPGMVFTIEPAVYIPGFGGVRIEDMVLVTDGGCEVLTEAKQEALCT